MVTLIFKFLSSYERLKTYFQTSACPGNLRHFRTFSHLEEAVTQKPLE